MNCEYCQSPAHIWFQCPKKPDGWKPARLAKTTSTEDNVAKPLLSNKQALGAGAKSGSNRAAEPAANPDKAGGADKGIDHSKSGVQHSVRATALPVDTNSPQTQKASSGNADGGKPLTQTRPANPLKPNPDWYAGIDALPGHEPPPHNPKFDKKAWMRKNMPAYMRQYRADVKAGKRVPKKREC